MYSSSEKRKQKGKKSLKAARMRIGSMTPDSSRRSRSNSRRRSALKRDMAEERYQKYLKRHPSKDKKKKGTTRKNVGKKSKTTAKASTKKAENPYTIPRRAAPVRTERGTKGNLTILVKPKNKKTLGAQLEKKGFIEVRTTRAGILFKHPAIERVAEKAAISNADIDKITAQMDAIAGLGRIEKQIKAINKKQKVNNDDFDALIGNLEGVKIAADSADDLTTMMASLRA